MISRFPASDKSMSDNTPSTALSGVMLGSEASTCHSSAAKAHSRITSAPLTASVLGDRAHVNPMLPSAAQPGIGTATLPAERCDVRL